MRKLYWLALVVLVGVPGGLEAQGRVRDLPGPRAQVLRVRPLPPELAVTRSYSRDSTAHRPFFLPRPGEHTAYWVGFGAGLAVSPLLWCDGCSTVSNASTSLLVSLGGAVTGLLLSRAF
jgi:hypothetical protein